MDYPKLRRIDVFPFETSGEKVIAVSYPIFFIISLFDGARSLNDIKAEYMRRYGDILYAERLEEIISYLDEQYLLDSERYAVYNQKQEEEFRIAENRRAVFVGNSYEAEPLNGKTCQRAYCPSYRFSAGRFLLCLGL